jgi:hypothetical protein
MEDILHTVSTLTRDGVVTVRLPSCGRDGNRKLRPHRKSRLGCRNVSSPVPEKRSLAYPGDSFVPREITTDVETVWTDLSGVVAYDIRGNPPELFCGSPNSFRPPPDKYVLTRNGSASFAVSR